MSVLKQLLWGTAAAAALAWPAAAQTATGEAPETGQAEESAQQPSEGAAPTADTVVATVNGTEITLGHLIVARARLPEQYQQIPDPALLTGLLDQLIQQAAVGSKAEGLSKGSELALENERRSFLAGEALTGITEGAVTDEALQALYDERFASAAPTQEFNASHILVETEEEAKAIKAEIDAGADFAEVARTKSSGPSGPNGGDLGWFGPGMMVEPFEAAVTALEAGQVSDPVQTQFGWHVIKLNEVRQKAAPTLDEVREELSNELRTRAVDAAVAEAMASAEITRNVEGIDPAVLRNLDLIAE